MKFHRDQYVIALYGAVIVLALVLFPEWIAVHPSTDLTMSLGHGSIFSPRLRLKTLPACRSNGAGPATCSLLLLRSRPSLPSLRFIHEMQSQNRPPIARLAFKAQVSERISLLDALA